MAFSAAGGILSAGAPIAQTSGGFSAANSSSSSISAPQRAESLAPETAPLVAVNRLDLSNADRKRLRTAVETGDWRRAEQILAAAVRSRPESAELQKAFGAVCFQNRRYLESAIAYQRAARLAELDEQSRFTLATSYIALGREHWARPELEKLAAVNPRNPHYPHWLARVYYGYQWFEEAIEEAKKAIALDPDFAPAHDRFGLCLEGLGKTAEAQREFREAVRLNRRSGVRSPWPSYHLGSLLHDLGELEEAAAALQEALRADASLAEAHYEIGVILHKQHKSADAVKALQRAAELDPTDPKPHYVLAQVYRRINEKEKAMEEVRRFRELSGK